MKFQIMEAIVTVSRITEGALMSGNLTGNGLKLIFSVFKRETTAYKL